MKQCCFTRRMLNMFLVGLPVWMIVAIATTRTAWSCELRDYGNGGAVCVCNATYCDFYEESPQPKPGEFSLHVSSKEGLRLSPSLGNLTTNSESDGITIVVNTTIQYQQILGFGGAFTDSVGIALNSLTAETRKQLMKSYFGSAGSNYNFARLPIAGTDFSTYPYSYDDQVADDATLSNFSLKAEDFELKIPHVKDALTLSEGKLLLMAAIWAPPVWMKTNGRFNGSGSLLPQYYDTLADYHLRFLDEYNKNGIQFWAISAGNEPSCGTVPDYGWNCLGWTAANHGKWVAEHLGPKLKNSKFNETLLMALDDQRVFLPWYVDQMFKHEETESYIDGVAVHWYWDDLVGPGVLDNVHDKYPDKFILYTESSYEKKGNSEAVILGDWSRGEGYAANVLEDLNHWVTGWVDWNLVLDEEGGPSWAGNVLDAAIVVNATGGEFYKQPMFYALAHFSRFLPRGSTKIDLQGATKDLQATAVLTSDGLIRVVLMNKKTTEQKLNIEGCNGGVANFIAPPNSFITFSCNGASSSVE